MTVKEISIRAAREAQDTLEQIDQAQCEALADAIAAAPRVFSAGAGRAGNLMKNFAMRLMHMDLISYTVGESVTPGVAAGDLLIVGSGSGKTGSLVVKARRAKELGARVALITTDAGSDVARLADLVVVIPAISKLVEHTGIQAFQPMANVFEQCLTFVTDAVTIALMERLDKTSDEMYRNHANLE